MWGLQGRRGTPSLKSLEVLEMICLVQTHSWRQKTEGHLLYTRPRAAWQRRLRAQLPPPDRLQLPLLEPDRTPRGKMKPIKCPSLKNACCPLAGFCTRRGNGVTVPIWGTLWGQDSVKERPLSLPGSPWLSLALPGSSGSLGLGRTSCTV